jgi:DME family drug/metabolite transporter
MHHRRSTRRALLLVTLAAIAWGTGGATGALLSEYAGLTPTATSFWRLAAAALWLTLARPAARRATGPSVRPALRRGAVRPFGALPLHYVLSGAGLAICQLGYFAAIPRIGIGLATVIAVGAGPILITLGARERLTAALVGAVAGLALLTLDTAATPTNLAGLAAALLSAVGYSVTTLLNRNATDPITSAHVGFTTGALVLIPFAVTAGILPTSPIGWALIAFFGLIPTALAYTLFYAALRTLPASTAAVIALLEPVVATAIGLLAFHECLTPTAAVGAVVLLTAVAAQARRR